MAREWELRGVVPPGAHPSLGRFAVHLARRESAEPVFIDGRESARHPLVTGIPTFHLRSIQARQADGSVDVRLAVMMMQYFLDFGPMVEDGILSNYPPSVEARPAYPIFVSKVDADGNELAGVRLPRSKHRLPPPPAGHCAAKALARTKVVNRMVSTSPSRRLRRSGWLPAIHVFRSKSVTRTTMGT